MKRNRLIPFSWLPAAWGMKGKTRERAQAEYELEGPELERALINLDYVGLEREIKLIELDYSTDVITALAKDQAIAAITLSGDELASKLLEIEYIHNVITVYDRDRGIAKLTLKDKELEIRLLEIDFAERKLTDMEYEKQLATLKGEGWVRILNVRPDGDKPNHGELELDWNDAFVEELRAGGYEGLVDEQVVDMWLSDLCRNIAMEQYTGTGDFDEKVPDQFIQKTPKSEEGKWEAK